ncbi:hypothetical protein [Dyadobacter sandarakinus]|uniref:Membrane protein involved in the export of O-antigen and teichoic acid n=1 Tax=Dyadobacter sandarakinus TaxID=2747268 RepID=A0ABX7ICZ5_9BACT|nr:hypothetical protein [Dyadobacter sandarakinus]QRR03860.1 hypothetical protein HWI92_24580 [Dyadobacter sandarakinus]
MLMKVLVTATVREFFRQKSGFFFVVLGIVFGFLRAQEHQALAIFFLTDAFGIFYLAGVWLAYTLFCAQFVNQLWLRQEYAFMYQAGLLPSTVQWARLAGAAFGLLMPVFLYGIYLLLTAFAHAHFRSLGLVAACWVAMLGILTAAVKYRLGHPHRVMEKRDGRSKLPFQRPASWPAWTIEWLFLEKGVTLLLGKLGAMLVCSATMLYYATDTYDLRLPAVGMALAYLLNAGISFEVFKWEQEVWLWTRSLPVAAYTRFFRVVLVHAALILPESLMMLRSEKLVFTEICQLYLLGLGGLVLLHLFFYKKRGLLEDCLPTILFAFIAATLLIMYHIPPWLLAAAMLVFAGWKFRSWYKI